MKINTIFIVSTNRSDYGLLQILIKKIDFLTRYKLKVIRLLNNELFFIDKTIKVEWDEEIIPYNSSSFDNQKSLSGLLEIGKVFADLLLKYEPKLIIVLGDRYELLQIISQALISNIKIAHISGGEITLGAIDDKIRNMVSFASSIHFVAHKEAKDRLELLLGKRESHNIHEVGEPGLEEIKNTNLKSNYELSEIYKLDLTDKFILSTFHPETNNRNFKNDAETFFNTLLKIDNRYPLLISFGNNDPIGFDLNKLMKDTLSKRSNTYICNSFGQVNFWSLLSYAHLIIGNSSCGLVEAPFLGCWTIDVGNRQNGRIFGKTVKRVAINQREINDALLYFLNKKRSEVRSSPYGNGITSNLIIKVIDNFFKNESY